MIKSFVDSILSVYVDTQQPLGTILHKNMLIGIQMKRNGNSFLATLATTPLHINARFCMHIDIYAFRNRITAIYFLYDGRGKTPGFIRGMRAPFLVWWLGLGGSC